MGTLACDAEEFTSNFPLPMTKRTGEINNGGESKGKWIPSRGISGV